MSGDILRVISESVLSFQNRPEIDMVQILYVALIGLVAGTGGTG